MNNKSIDINQRIPLATLYAALESYLNGLYSNDYVVEQLRLEFDGENRLKKALRIVNKIVLKNPLNEFVLKNKDELIHALKKKGDRDIILISLLNSAFPFSYDVLRILGKYLSVQDVISTETIKRPIFNIYGGNRATDNGLYSVIPMFIEANLFSRPKVGIYKKKEPLVLLTKISLEIYIKSFELNNTITELRDHHRMDPYFIFVK